MSKKTKSILLRVDEDTYAQLKANVKGVINDWIVDAINSKLALSNPTLIVPGIDDLLKSRQRWANDDKRSTQFLAFENYVFTHQSEALNVEQLSANWLSDIEFMFGRLMCMEYFEPLCAMDKSVLAAYVQQVQELKLKLKLVKDEVVHGGVTAKDIALKLNKDTTYTLNDIAEQLNTDYIRAFRYFKPWLLAHGYKVVLGKDFHVKAGGRLK